MKDFLRDTDREHYIYCSINKKYYKFGVDNSRERYFNCSRAQRKSTEAVYQIIEVTKKKDNKTHKVWEDYFLLQTHERLMLEKSF